MFLVVGLVGLLLGALPASAQVRLRPKIGARTGFRGSGKLSPRLSVLSTVGSFASPRAEADALSLPAAGAGSLVRETDRRVLVEIRTSSTSKAAVAQLGALGARIVNVSPAYSVVTAAVAPAALDAIAGDADVLYVSEVLAPVTAPVNATSATDPGAGAARATPAASGCHPVVSDGDALMNADAARAADSVDGAGQTIGVLSDSFDTDGSAATHASGDVASGELPGPGNPCGRTTPVVVQSDYSAGGQTDEGRAMAELAHGLAPGARLAFAESDNGQFDFASQINELRNDNHATEMVDDNAYLDEPFFQDGPVASAANAASAAGVAYFSAAGNENVIVGGNNVGSYETPSFRSTDCPASILAGEPALGCHNFDTTGGTDNSDDITVAPSGGFTLDLQWAQPWGAVATDYDAFVLDSSGNVVASSTLDQAQLEEPFELLSYDNSGPVAQTVHVVIAKFSGADNPRMKFVLFGAVGLTAVQYNTSTGGDIVGPAIFGHSGAATVGSTGAVDYNDSSTPEAYSSRGPATLYFEPTPGTAALASPEVLDKPDFVATDDVLSAFLGDPAGGGLFRFAGTSAAAPQAAAIGALLRQYDPALSPAGVMSTLRATARPVATNGTPSDVGGGYLDAAAALASVVPLPGAAQSVFTTNGNARVTVHWTAAPASPKFPITGYTVTPSLNGVPQAQVPFGSSATSEQITGLTNGASYTFSVTATDANGPGAPSPPSPPVVVGQPGDTGSIVAVPGNGRAIVSWKAPTLTYGLPIVGYDVLTYASSGNNETLVSHQVFASTATTETITGLTNGGSYSFAVEAMNGTSSGEGSTLSVPIAVGTPLAPAHVTASSGNGNASVHWAPASANGSAITGYRIQILADGALSGGRLVGATATGATVTPLSPGHKYSFVVTARNHWGSSPPSVRTSTIVVGAPRAPTSVVATAAHQSAIVHWTAPASEGKPITGYTVTPYVAGVTQGARVFHSAATAEKVTGLVTGKHYTFKVAATNSRGTGLQSVASNAVKVT